MHWTDSARIDGIHKNGMKLKVACTAGVFCEEWTWFGEIFCEGRCEKNRLFVTVQVMKSIRSSMSFASIFQSLDSVLKVLTAIEVRDLPEVQKILNICAEEGIVEELNGQYSSSVATDIEKDTAIPFMVIEGLDGSGKTSLAAEVQKRYDMRAMQTPPGAILEFRSFFDSQPEPIRRAFYSLGNYLAAESVLRCTEPVVMDRFWHSTAAYGIGNDIKRNANTDLGELKLDWPGDLLQPNMVLFLFVSETERLRRHSSRLLQTNTPEEQSLAKDQAFRENIVSVYRSIKGPKFVEIDADASKEEVQNRIFKVVEAAFPALIHRIR
ncbi:unnamed protein product [Allacma fusca]|uniref:Thymidylate kinase-like domain-containing protein n=1 Tax=Allacma fusca TaxID=39272 RepID=A0A8J2JTD6_9HEXA|nr:unnamed protein product [Allacma fusca]